MRPILQAIKLRHEDGGDFVAELRAHLLHGYVILTDCIFLMGRPCPRDADMTDLLRSWPVAECDAWFVWVGVGDMRELVAAMPFPLPWVGFYRQGRGRAENSFIPTARIRRG